MLGLHCCPGLCLSVGSGATLQLWFTGFLLQWPLWLWSIGCRVLELQWLQFVGSVIAVPRLWSTDAVRRLSCYAAGGIFPDQGSNPCLLHG